MVISIKEIEKINNIYGKFIIGSLYKGRLKKVVNLVNLKNKKILDIGFGYGILILFIKNKTEKIYGININEFQTKKTKEILFNEGINVSNLITGDITKKTEFNDSFFNVIFANSVLEHIKHLDSALIETKRILDDSGYFIVSTPTENFFYLIGRSIFGFKKPEDHYNDFMFIEYKLKRYFNVLKTLDYPSPLFPLYRIVLCKK